jgi:hypothetical protein
MMDPIEYTRVPIKLLLPMKVLERLGDLDARPEDGGLFQSLSRSGGRRRVWGMRYFLLLIMAVALVGCASRPTWVSDPSNRPTWVSAPSNPQNVIVEKAIRHYRTLNKPKGRLTMTDLEKVTRLWLDNTKTTDEGLKEVAKCKQLSFLHLWNTQITDAGLKELAELVHLSELYLQGTKTTNAGLKELTKLKQLEYLNLQHTKVTKEGVAELQRALPKCKIRSNPTK